MESRRVPQKPRLDLFWRFHPLPSHRHSKLRKLSAGSGYSHDPLLDPFQRHFPEGKVVIFSLNLGQFSQEFGIDAESTEGFEEATKSL
jgi:hypothetical protein